MTFLAIRIAPAFAQQTPPGTAPETAQENIQGLDAQQAELLRKEKELLESLKAKQEPLKNTSKKIPPSTPAVATKKTDTAPVTKTAVSTSPPAIPSATPTAKSLQNQCEEKLQKSDETIARLRKELDETRSRLAISETEVERLAYLIDDKNKGGAPKRTTPSAQTSTGLRVREPGEIQAKADQDMAIATVIAEKAQLRTGPGMNNSPLMTVGKGTRLAIETRSGDWYRVIAPSGARAWVSSDVIDFGSGTKSNTPSFARNPGLSDAGADAAEAAAFEAIIRGGKK